jgi:hypothetical protein
MHQRLRLRETVTTYILMTGLGLVLAFGALYGDRSVARRQPRLVEINPTIPKSFLQRRR